MENNDSPTTGSWIAQAASVCVDIDFTILHGGILTYYLDMRIKILHIGKVKDEFAQIGRKKYLKLLSPYAKVDMIKVKEQPKTASFSVEKILKVEGEALLQRVSKDDYVVALDERGQQLGSVEFARFLKRHAGVGRVVCFVMGGSFGLDSAVKERADKLLSLSKMTFTHQMTQVFLMEQLYRGVCIISGKEYHVA